jgi:hypothetical protein
MLDFFLLLAQSPSPECLPQYPRTVSGKEICIPPPPPPDLSCSDIKDKYGESVIVVDAKDRNPDPHNLDADNDGVGCESLSR